MLASFLLRAMSRSAGARAARARQGEGCKPPASAPANARAEPPQELGQRSGVPHFHAARESLRDLLQAHVLPSGPRTMLG